MKKWPVRTAIVFSIDIAMTAFSLVASYALLHGVDHLSLLRFKVAAALCAGLALVIYPSYGLYRNLWRYVSIVDLARMGQATLFLIAMFYGLWWSLGLPSLSPASSYPIIHLMVLLFCLGGPRILRRAIANPALIQSVFKGSGKTTQRSLLLIAPPAEAEMFIRAQSLGAAETAFQIVGICDPTGTEVGRAIHGVPVLGVPSELKQILQKVKSKPARVGIAADAFSSLPHDFEAICAAYGLTPAQLPDSGDLKEREDAARMLKPIAIEDILGRSQQSIDLSPVRKLLMNRTILITGAGGSIGSELMRQIANLQPRRLILIEQSEVALYHVEREASEKFFGLKYEAMLGDVRDEAAIESIFAKHKPDFVFHAAALKHVPIVEAQPYEGILTNVWGTQVVARAAGRHGAQAFVLISTDKAVAPLSFMGASKRVAEMIVQAMDRAGGGTRYFSVRFGNVLGSSGSVVPLFRRQIEEGGPVTVTHEDMTRFFMTVREAVGLVLQATGQGVNSAMRGAVYVLDMGRPVKIIDVARQMIRLAGLVPDKDIEVKIVGLRPGEKLHESLFCEGEAQGKTALPSVMEAESGAGQKPVEPLLDAALRQDRAEILRVLQDLVPDLQINA